MNIGVRHILPMYAFIAVLGAGALWAFASRDQRWVWAAAAILALHAGSSVRAFPSYIAYSNELWGGPSRTYKHLSDSNSDWAQQLKSLKKYLDARGVRDCWFAYFGQGTADLGYYGIPCRPLPTLDGFWLKEVPQVPAQIEGTVVISAGVLRASRRGRALPPVWDFREDPSDGADRRWTPRLRRALRHRPRVVSVARGEGRGRAGRRPAGGGPRMRGRPWPWRPARSSPTSCSATRCLALGRADEAFPIYRAALTAARTIEPEFQVFWIGILEAVAEALTRRQLERSDRTIQAG
jgi:hypothetical protein